jgi:hypothetical protein
MLRLLLEGFGVWLLVSTVMGLLLGQLMSDRSPSVIESGLGPFKADGFERGATTARVAS